MPPKPVVFVPGLPGSSLVAPKTGEEIFFRPRRYGDGRWKKEHLDGLRGPENPNADDGVEAGEALASLFDADEPFLDIAPGKQADTLGDLLGRFGHRRGQWRSVAWDWRRPIDAPPARAAVARAIRELAAAEGGKVAVVAHGAGGLLARAALEADEEALAAVGDLIFCGVPWQGSLEPLRYLAAQETFAGLAKKEVAEIAARSWALWETLPPPSGEGTTGDEPVGLEIGEEVHSPLAFRDWIGKAKARAPWRRRAERAAEEWPARLGPLDLGPVRVWNLAGWGTATLGRARWAEGELSFSAPAAEGDGVVPLASARALEGPQVRSLVLPLGGFTPTRHATLWMARSARPLLREILTEEQPWIEHIHAVPDAEDAGGDPAVVRVRVIAQDEMGRALPAASARLVDHPEEDAVEATADGRMVLGVHRHRWRWTRADVRQVRVVVAWEDDGRARQKDLRVLAGREEPRR